ncbi:MAG: FecR domain-containing protein [Chitinophaga sp.]|uniref:FecR family protein n=1 Tax=Chitinophaga sp. TaxID=1869181 RepID=UPI001B297922|nr:FecR family protein [Chitinophaga sp.]MBO9728119.1 FecR domain-containing protein [Chitinophaga sp.]
MEQNNMQDLLKRYLAGDCTPEERVQVEQWYELLESKKAAINEEELEEDVAEVRTRLVKSFRKDRKLFRYPAVAAAAVLIIISIGTYFQFRHRPSGEVLNANKLLSNAPDIAPGRNIAILQLSDGTEIALDEQANGAIAKAGSNTIYKNANGQLTYVANESKEKEEEALVSNTLKTPRGGQFQLTLPDGSKVWLNAASTLTYKISRTSRERLVELKGEAYFEVARDANRPFKVLSKGQVIEVLGTHFNVSSYDDEPSVKTTLAEGAVKIVETNKHRDVVLEPGQQATLDSGNTLSVAQVDVSDAIAWKNGKLNFNQSDIYAVARQLSRWYNVDVVFKGKASKVRLSGEVYRNTNASKVLEILSFYNLNCRIETDNGVKRIVIE